jgi:hypothetical protein
MKRLIVICALCALMLPGCSGWAVEPLPYITSTPFPSLTPIILSPTPIILPLPVTATGDATLATLTDTPTTSTGTVTQVVTQTITITPTTSVPITFTPTITSTPSASINAEILSCNNSIDIRHGMGEVANAYITIQNTGHADLTNLCATLSALDEGRVHPDKTKCVAILPAGYQVSEKLTVDITAQQASSIQVAVNAGGNLLQRVGQNACTNFDLIPPRMHDLGSITPIQTP